MKKQLARFWKYICGVNGLLLILYSIFIFTTFAFVAEDNIKYFLRWSLLIVVLSIICCPMILNFAKRRRIQLNSLAQQSAKEMKLKILYFAIPFFLFLIKYLIYYPGVILGDSFEQYTQAITNQYNDWHPAIQTLLAMKLPLMLTGGWIGSIMLFQIIVFSIVLAYTFWSIKKYANTKYSFYAMAFILLNPQTTNIAMYPWKDVSFAIGALLLTTSATHIYFTSGQWIKQPVNMIMFAVAFALTTLFRHNAMLFTLPMLLAVVLLIEKRRALILVISAVVLIVGIKGPLYSVLNVETANQRQVEMLGLPMTVIGAAVTYAPEQLDEETLEFAYKVAPKEVWEEKFSYGNYNAVKWMGRTNNDVIEEYGTGKVLSMALNCMKRCPGITLKSLIKLTDTVYTVCDDYSYHELPGSFDNVLWPGFAIFQQINAVASDRICFMLPWLFMYFGSIHLILLVFILAKCKLNEWRSWKKILLVLPVFAYNFGTALLLTGASDCSRFFFYTFLLAPILLVILLGEKNERRPDGSIRVQA